MIRPKAEIRLVTLDLDGTIVSGVGASPSPRVREAIRASQARGVAVAFATARWIIHARELAEALGITVPCVCQDGAQVYDFATRRLVNQVGMDPGAVRELMALAGNGLQVQAAVRADERLYTRHPVHDPAFWREWLCESDPVEIGPDGVFPAEVSQVLLVCPDEQTVGRYAARAREVAGNRARVQESFGRVVDIDPAPATKAVGVAWLAGHLGVPREQVLALEDWDASVLAWAGVGVAMGNGPEEAKAAADWVAPGVAEDGAAVALERFVL